LNDAGGNVKLTMPYNYLSLLAATSCTTQIYT